MDAYVVYKGVQAQYKNNVCSIWCIWCLQQTDLEIQMQTQRYIDIQIYRYKEYMYNMYSRIKGIDTYVF